MPSPLETYLDKFAALDAAERDAQEAIAKIDKASRILKLWKDIQFPGMPNMSMGRALSTQAPKLPEWPVWPDIVAKLRAYHEAITALDAAYEAVPENYRAGLRSPPPRRGELRAG